MTTKGKLVVTGVVVGNYWSRQSEAAVDHRVSTCLGIVVPNIVRFSI